MVREEFVTACIALAKDSQCTKKHAALIVKGSKVLAAAVNKKKTHPAIPSQHSYHAEAAAMLRMPPSSKTKGANLYSFRDDYGKMSRPCSSCIKMARRHGIKVMVYCMDVMKGYINNGVTSEDVV